MISFDYIDRIKDLISVIETKEQQNMEEAVSLLCSAVLNKKSIFTFGASHAGILSEELYYRAGGLVVVNPIFARELMLDTSPITHTSNMERLVGYGEALMKGVNIKEGDILIAHSVSGRNCVSIEVAMEAKKKGAIIIVLTNLSYSKLVESRHPSGLKLFELADLVIDNHGDVGDACISLEGVEQKVGPTSTVIGATVLNSIIVATAQQLIEKGMSHPPIFYSANLDGGDDLNRSIYTEFKDSIHYKY